MAKKSAQEQLEELLKKQEVIKNRIASIEARAKRDADKQLTRRKILVGAYFGSSRFCVESLESREAWSKPKQSDCI
jgi:hypothetical protein